MFDPHVAGPRATSFDAVAVLRRDAATVHRLARDLEEAVAQLPHAGTAFDWWGPAREAVQGALDIERERLGREVWRLDGVVIQLRYEAEVTESALSVEALP